MNTKIVPVLLAALLGAGLATAGASDPRAVLRLLGSRDAGDRLRAVKLLREVPGAGATARLVLVLGDEDAEVRSKAESALRLRGDPDDLSVIASRGLRHPRPFARRAALRLLAARRVEDLPRHLQAALSDPDPVTREAAVGITVNALARLGLPTLAAAVTRGREGRPRATALLAVHRLDPEAGIDLARKVREDRSLEVRVAATEILGAIPGAAGLAAAELGLRDESWSVRLTAVRILSLRAKVGSIPPLIAALRREDGRLREEVGEALAALTGVGLPADPKRWATWWAKARCGFKVPEKPTRPPQTKDESVVTFHSIPVVSRSVAFVLDRSRSMRQRVARDEERRKGEQVETELRETLERMGRPSRFLLVAFRTEAIAFQPRPVPIAARRRAADWYASLEPSGRTNLYDALAIALAEPSVDTIFLLTDGAPSAGEHRHRGAILTAVARANRYRKAVLHTVDIGGGTTGKRWKGFLAELARMTGGRHVKR